LFGRWPLRARLPLRYRHRDTSCRVACRPQQRWTSQSLANVSRQPAARSAATRRRWARPRLENYGSGLPTVPTRESRRIKPRQPIATKCSRRDRSTRSGAGIRVTPSGPMRWPPNSEERSDVILPRDSLVESVWFSYMTIHHSRRPKGKGIIGIQAIKPAATSCRAGREGAEDSSPTIIKSGLLRTRCIPGMRKWVTA
jgi:hypothetical protein